MLLPQEEVFLQATGAAHGADEGASICVGDVGSTIQARVSRDLAAASTPTAAAHSMSSFLPRRLSQRSSGQLHSSSSMADGLTLDSTAEAGKQQPAPTDKSPASSDDDGLLLQPATPGRSPDSSVHGDSKSKPAQQAAGADKGVVDEVEPPKAASVFSSAAADSGHAAAEHFAAKAQPADTAAGRLRQHVRFLREMLLKRARIAGRSLALGLSCRAPMHRPLVRSSGYSAKTDAASGVCMAHLPHHPDRDECWQAGTTRAWASCFCCLW